MAHVAKIGVASPLTGELGQPNLLLGNRCQSGQTRHETGGDNNNFPSLLTGIGIREGVSSAMNEHVIILFIERPDCHNP